MDAETTRPDPLVLPPDEFEAVQKVAGMLGMDRPAPALGERPGAAMEPAGATLTEAVVAAIAADAEWARTRPCGPTWTRPPYEQVRRLIAAEWKRADAAEARLAEVEAYCRDECEVVNEGMRLVAIVRASDILAIIGSEEGSDVR